MIYIEVDLGDLKREAELLQKQLDVAMSENQAFSQLVQKLELEYKIRKRKPNYIK